MYCDYDAVETTASWKAVNTKLYKNAFLAGSRDNIYESPIRKLEAQFLAKALAVSGMHRVKVLVNSSNWWDVPRGGLLLMVGVSFQVTADGWAAVDRDWRAGGEIDRARSAVCLSDNFEGSLRMARRRRRLSRMWRSRFLRSEDDSEWDFDFD